MSDALAGDLQVRGPWRHCLVAEGVSRARSGFWDSEDWQAGSGCLLDWSQQDAVTLGPAASLSSQTAAAGGSLSVVCPRCWWRWCMAGAGGLLVVERAAACAGWASDTALGVSLVLPVPHEPLNTLQLIPFHSKPAREDSGFCNWTLTEKRELHKQIS